MFDKIAPSPFTKAEVLSVDILRGVCKCKTRRGMLLNQVGWLSIPGQFRETGENFSPLPGEVVYLTNVDGELLIIGSKRVLDYGSSIRSSIGNAPPVDAFKDNYNISPLSGQSLSGGSMPMGQVPGDRTTTNDRGGLFGLLRSGSFIAKASPTAQLFISRIDSLFRIVYRNLEEFGESIVRVSVNLRGRLYNYKGTFNTQAKSQADIPVMYEVDGDVAAGQVAKDKYLTATGLPGTDNKIYTRVVPLYDGDGNEIGKTHRVVLGSDGSFNQEALSESQDSFSTIVQDYSNLTLTVTDSGGNSFTHLEPTKFTINSAGTVIATFDGTTKKITLHADNEIDLTTTTLSATVLGTMTATVTGLTTINATGNTIHNGNLQVNGILGAGALAVAAVPGVTLAAGINGVNLIVTGGDVKADGIGLKTHEHPVTGIQTGSGSVTTGVGAG